MEQNINPHIDRSADIELLFSVLPANFREVYQWRVSAARHSKICGDRIEWKAQLNVRNAIGEGGPIGVTVQPWGEHAISRLPPERRWYVTNTFNF